MGFSEISWDLMILFYEISDIIGLKTQKLRFCFLNLCCNKNVDGRKQLGQSNLMIVSDGKQNVFVLVEEMKRLGETNS